MPFVCTNGQMVVISLIENEMHLAAQRSFFLVVLQVNVAELHTHLHLVSCGKTFQLLLVYFPLSIEEPHLTILQHLAFEIVVDVVLFLHDLDIFRTNQHAYFRAGQVLMIVLHQELIVIGRQHTHLVVHTLEDTRLYLAVPFGELTLRYPILRIIFRPVRLVRTVRLPDINILRTNNHLHRFVLAETGVDTIELLAAELYSAVADHGAG